MNKAIRWFVRVCALGILCGVWWVLPQVMPGASRFMRAAELCVLCAAVCLSCAALLATILPATPRRQTAAQSPRVRLNAATVAEIMRRNNVQKAGGHRDTRQ